MAGAGALGIVATLTGGAIDISLGCPDGVLACGPWAQDMRGSDDTTARIKVWRMGYNVKRLPKRLPSRPQVKEEQGVGLDMSAL